MNHFHSANSPSDLTDFVIDNSRLNDEPLADSYLFTMTHNELVELGKDLGTSPDYFVRRASDARRECRQRQLGIYWESKK